MSLHKSNTQPNSVNITNRNYNSIYITTGFILLLTAITVMSGVGFMLVTLLAAFVHELGHMACVYLCGGGIRGLRLGAAGAELSVEGHFTYIQDALIALSGPSAGAILSAGALCAGELTGTGWLYGLGAVSLVYTLFNLIPVGSLDGGRALYALVCNRWGPDIAARTCLICDILFSAVFAGLGLYVLIASRGNATALICSFFVIKGCCKKE